MSQSAGAQLLSEQQLDNATQNWLYQQIEDALTPAVTNLKLRELEVQYLLTAVASTPVVAATLPVGIPSNTTVRFHAVAAL